jgi:hypothetical protein
LRDENREAGDPAAFAYRRLQRIPHACDEMGDLSGE